MFDCCGQGVGGTFGLRVTQAVDHGRVGNVDEIFRRAADPVAVFIRKTGCHLLERPAELVLAMNCRKPTAKASAGHPTAASWKSREPSACNRGLGTLSTSGRWWLQ
jgi:hypothetical protein